MCRGCENPGVSVKHRTNPKAAAGGFEHPLYHLVIGGDSRSAGLVRSLQCFSRWIDTLQPDFSEVIDQTQQFVGPSKQP
jgi:hypothetical protein